jgi:hypothetical protein
VGLGLRFQQFGVLRDLCDLLFKTYLQLCGPQTNAFKTRAEPGGKESSPYFRKSFPTPPGKSSVFPAGKLFPPARNLAVCKERPNVVRISSARIGRALFHFPPFWISIETGFLRA